MSILGDWQTMQVYYREASGLFATSFDSNLMSCWAYLLERQQAPWCL